MTVEERTAWISGFVVIVAYAIYAVTILRRVDGALVSEVAYLGPLLWTVGVIVVGTIVLSIIGAIVNAIVTRGEPDERTDERDRAIGRRADRISNWVTSAVAIGALVLAVREAPHFWIANAIYAGLVVSMLVGSVAKIVIYRRGF